MKYLIPGIAITVSLVLIVASCLLNWTFWFGQGRTEWESHVIGAVAVSFDILKSILPVLIVWAIAAGRWIEATMGSVLFVLFFAAALVSAVGFFSTNRSGIAGSQETKNERLDLAKAEADELSAKLARYPQTDTSLKISADMAAMRTERRWKSTSECADATVTKSRSFCQRYEGLKGNHATAVARERAEQNLARVRKDIRSLQSVGAGKESDPQAAIISRIVSLVIPIDKADANFSIVVFFSSLVELGAALGLYLSVSHWPRREVPAQAQPETVVLTASPIDRTNAVTLLPPPIEIKSMPTQEQHEAFKAWKESAA